MHVISTPVGSYFFGVDLVKKKKKKKAPVSFLLVKASYHVIATLLTSCTIKGTLWIISGLLL